MARSKHRKPAPPPAPRPRAPATAAVAGSSSASWVVFVLALMLLLVPALGVPHEEMLQDTLKSMLVAFFTLGAAGLFLWLQRRRTAPLHLHVVPVFPLLLLAWALGSMGWSHTFLAGVEAVRWFVFAVLLWTALNTLEKPLLDKLATGAHAGAVLACLWGLLQFWIDMRFFPQGPNPASTFVNRNFAAEYVVCVLPLSAWLLLRAASTRAIVVMAFTLAFNLVFLLCTGTRSALLALVLLVVLVPVAAVLFRNGLPAARWGRDQRYIAGSVLAATLLVLGSIPSGNPEIIQEHQTDGRGLTALARAFQRTLSVTQREEYTQRSFSLRWTMWKATGRMIADRPLSGVGAGAWEVAVPLYQTGDTQLETDYYVHNEILQLLAEYGLVGWAALLGLLAWLARAALRTLALRGAEHSEEGLLRSTALLGLLAFLVVSNAGFPWRLAATGALFALYLGVLAASDIRAGDRSFVRAIAWRPAFSAVGLVLVVLCLALAAWVSRQAAEAEQKLVRAVKLALTISQSGQADDPRWEPVKQQMLQLVREGVVINPHYRKVTPMAADELARWGDWKNAVWIWESIAASRPNVPALMLNIARGHAQLGETVQARDYMERSRRLLPGALALASIEVVILGKEGRDAEATALARRYLASGRLDPDLANAAYALGRRTHDWTLALDAMEQRNRLFPDDQVDGWLRIARIHVEGTRDEARALAAFRAALAAVPDSERAAARQMVPQPYQDRL